MIPWPIAELLPHAGDMILLDAVLAFDDDHVATRLQVRPGLLSDADGGLPAWVGVELMAQSVAAYAGCHARRAGQPVALGFLLGTRRFTCNVERFPAGSELRIDATCSLQDDNGMGVFECRLQGPGILAEARLNVYRPPQPSRFLEEPAP
ncbi:ApeP family dehydratase [Pseudomonas mangiferae]|uniref:3-hydroxylacyl-ACP dehydratase n=1 Tax=Pseudomonas mangiferae TaxID=2593654 RepID=A0A553GYX8_9PSED|nr:hotdog family protein [Pseudomonas mangiferae]TRX74718.1 3-hydroxylacyl-ACP dehydratase [Pseudomonas mangiferae]